MGLFSGVRKYILYVGTLASVENSSSACETYGISIDGSIVQFGFPETSSVDVGNRDEGL